MRAVHLRRVFAWEAPLPVLDDQLLGHSDLINGPGGGGGLRDEQIERFLIRG